MKRLIRVANVLLVVGLVLPASAQAQVSLGPTPCASSTLTQFNPDAVACFGAASSVVAPNYMSVLTTDFLAYVGAGAWTYQGTTNAGTTAGPFSYVPASFTGVLLFDAPLSGIFAIALSSSTQYSIYLFNSATNLAGIDFTTIGTSLVKQGIPNVVAQASLYTYLPSGGGGSPPVTSTPEPGTLLLAASGIASLGGYMKRRRRA